jgi:hypothetical protein
VEEAMIEVITGDTVLLELVLVDGDTSRFPQAEIYDDSGVAIGASPVDLSSVSGGLYQGTFVAPVVGNYSIVYITYSDVAHTIVVGNIERVAEHLRVTNSVQDDVWDEAIAGHLTAGSTGLALDDASTSGTTPSAISAAVWAEALPGAFGAGEAGKIVGDNVNATISSRSTLTQADILSDATPFPGADIDAAISSRSSHTAADVDALVTASHGVGSYITATGFAVAGDNMGLTAAGVDAVWDEPIAGHLGVGSVGEALNDASSGAGVDWTVSERSQMRQALGITGATLATAAGELQDVLADTAAIEPLVTTNVDATISSRSTLTQADILSDATPFPGADIDAAISTRSSHTAADVDALVTASHGAGSYQTATGFAVAGDNMGLTPAATAAVDVELTATHGAGAWTGGGAGLTQQQVRDAMKLSPTAGAPAAGSVDTHLDDIEADTSAMQPVVAANLDATVSSRGTADPGDAMTLTAGERTAIDTELSGTHGAGLWESDSDTDWTTGEKEQIRQALGVTGATAATAAGELQDVLADTAAMQPTIATNLDVAVSTRATPGDAMSLDSAGVDAIFDESLAGHLATGTAGQALAAAFGNAGGNVRDDALTYDANDRPLTLRRRIFPDAATANASTPGGVGEGELMTVTISATQIDAAKWETLLRTV